MKNKLIVLILFMGVSVGLLFGYSFSHNRNSIEKEVLSAQTTGATLSQNQKVSPVPSSPGIPQTISIPKINVQAKIESVAMDSQGRMDVPKEPRDTAWYSPGFRPGMKGSAVIDGHLDLVTGAPAVFWNLKELTPGDKITVTDDKGTKYTFAVSEVIKYPYNSFPIKQVFSASNIPMLNLITCNGVWDKNTKNYSDRLVVYSKLVAQN